LRPWRDGWRHLRFMLLFSPRWLFLYPGLTLMLAGLVFGAMLVHAPIAFSSVTFDVNTLLFAAAAILIGFQAVSFAVLSKFFTIRAGLRLPEAHFECWVRRLTLEAGLLTGAILVLVGFYISADAVWIWGDHGFGPLFPQEMLRRVIPGALCLTLGCQLILTSFFLSVLRLDTKSASS
jgi:hypothetical protein